MSTISLPFSSSSTLDQYSPARLPPPPIPPSPREALYQASISSYHRSRPPRSRSPPPESHHAATISSVSLPLSRSSTFTQQPPARPTRPSRQHSPLPPLPAEALHQTGAPSLNHVSPQNRSRSPALASPSRVQTHFYSPAGLSNTPTRAASFHRSPKPILQPGKTAREHYHQQPQRTSTFRIPGHTHPTGYTVFSFLVIFGLFTLLLFIAARYPTRAFWVIIPIFGVTSSVSLSLFYAWSFKTSKEKYRPNLGNSIAVVLTTIPTFTILYVLLWYPQLRKDILETSADFVDSVQFPSIALLQREDWSSQANLLSRTSGGGSKCFLGWYDDAAPACKDSIGFGGSCSCHDLWYNNDQVIEEYVYLNTTYRYLVLDSPSWFVSKSPATMLQLQASFNYNSTQSLLDSSTRLSPSLYMAVYDPTLGLSTSLAQGFSRLSLIPANGIVSIAVSLRLHNLRGLSAYAYDLSISSSPAMELTCDLGNDSEGGYIHDCQVSLFVQFTGFERVIVGSRKRMNWADVAASAGAYFSFVQFVSWIVSLQAFAGE